LSGRELPHQGVPLGRGGGDDRLCCLDPPLIIARTDERLTGLGEVSFSGRELSLDEVR
jgi:hypothetical protein